MSINNERVMPFYFVTDASGWTQRKQIDAVNEALIGVRKAAATEPDIEEYIRFGVISFSNDDQSDLPAGSLFRKSETTNLAGGILTSFASAFDFLKLRIDEDVSQLASKHGKGSVIRPNVFFLTDGLGGVSKERVPSRDRLGDPRWKRRPNIFSFGVGEADAPSISRIASNPDWAFVQDNSISTVEALVNFGEHMAKTMSQTAAWIASGDGESEVSAPTGFVNASEVPAS